jgi:hypothetical protein
MTNETDSLVNSGANRLCRNTISASKCCGVDHKTGYTVFLVTTKGPVMLGVHDGQVVPSQVAVARTAKSSSGVHWVLGTLMVIIGIGAIVGIVVAVTMGLTNIALAIGIIGCAFFARAWC